MHPLFLFHSAVAYFCSSYTLARPCAALSCEVCYPPSCDLRDVPAMIRRGLVSEIRHCRCLVPTSQPWSWTWKDQVSLGFGGMFMLLHFLLPLPRPSLFMLGSASRISPAWSLGELPSPAPYSRQSLRSKVISKVLGFLSCPGGGTSRCAHGISVRPHPPPRHVSLLTNPQATRSYRPLVLYQLKLTNRETHPALLVES